MSNILWMQTGACSGDTMSLLSADRPSLEQLGLQYGVKLLWQPPRPSIEALARSSVPFSPATKKRCPSVSKGSLMVGPGNTGMFDTWKAARRSISSGNSHLWRRMSSRWDVRHLAASMQRD